MAGPPPDCGRTRPSAARILRSGRRLPSVPHRRAPPHGDGHRTDLFHPFAVMDSAAFDRSTYRPMIAWQAPRIPWRRRMHVHVAVGISLLVALSVGAVLIGT